MILVRNAESLDICPSPSSELVPLRVLVIKEIVVKLEKVGILGDGDGGGDSTDGREQEGSEPDHVPVVSWLWLQCYGSVEAAQEHPVLGSSLHSRGQNGAPRRND